MGSVYSKSTTTERKTNLGRVWVCRGGEETKVKGGRCRVQDQTETSSKSSRERWKREVEKVVAQLPFTTASGVECESVPRGRAGTRRILNLNPTQTGALRRLAKVIVALACPILP